jgi:hypothetical protein
VEMASKPIVSEVGGHRHGEMAGRLLLARWQRWTIIDGRGGAKVRYRQSCQDRHPGESEESRGHGRAS